jgi:hypothetical protein
MTVRQLLESIDSRELTEWQIYEREHGPLGGERLDILAAKVMSVIVRVNADSKSQDKIKDESFLIKWSGGADSGNDS